MTSWSASQNRNSLQFSRSPRFTSCTSYLKKLTHTEPHYKKEVNFSEGLGSRKREKQLNQGKAISRKPGEKVRKQITYQVQRNQNDPEGKCQHRHEMSQLPPEEFCCIGLYLSRLCM